MKTDRLAFIKEHLSSFEIRFSEDGDFAEIINPYHGESVKVEYVPDDDFTPYTVLFSFQHRHIGDEDDVMEYIDEIIGEKRFAIEFFVGETKRFGTDITADVLKGLSYESLEEEICWWGNKKLADRADSFRVRGWNPSSNFDARFVTDENGAPGIQIIS